MTISVHFFHMVDDVVLISLNYDVIDFAESNYPDLLME